MNPIIAGLHLFAPEDAHALTIALLKTGLAPDVSGNDNPVLACSVFGKAFSNPVGLAAGFDKNAEVVHAMLRCGFGFVETGTVTPRPQAGNPLPRLFRWPEQKAVINRLGFNNKGLEVYCENLRRQARRALSVPHVIGGNIGRNKDSTDAIADYVMGFEAVAPLVDYITINVSSPNTPGLRGLQNHDELTALIKALQAKRTARALKTPLLVKIAPDLDDKACEDIAAVALETGLDGLIISNTTISRPAKMPPVLSNEAGGLSGPPVFQMSNAILSRMSALTRKKIPLVGVGGISSTADAYTKIRLGASLVQLYTGLVYQGPRLVAEIKDGLAHLLRRDGFANISEVVGVDVKL
jgi:dihydroorotate dehydrogenase